MNSFSKYSWLVTSLTLLIGFVLLHFEIISYGIGFFIAFPLSLGFSIGTMTKDIRKYLSISLGIVSFSGVLILIGWEGFFCVVIALPILFLSTVIGFYASRWFRQKRKTKWLRSSIVPFIVLLSIDTLEKMVLPEPQLVEVENSIVLDYPATQVFHAVKKMDTLNAPKPWALQIGLPTPYKCILASDTVGSKRTCLFSNGQIVAEITKYEVGEVLEMDVVSYSLTGRDWFEFVDAKYLFSEQDGKTKITRTSSYKSSLQPRAYWEPFEKWGIAQEHKFVLNSLKKNLAKMKKEDEN